MNGDKFIMYIGTYTGMGDDSDGIYILELDAKTGAVKRVGSTDKIDNPSYLCVAGDCLYAVKEEFGGGGKTGGIAAYKIDRDTGGLAFYDKKAVGQRGACHLDVSADKKLLAAANYGEGSVTLLHLNPDGSMGDVAAIYALTGELGPNRARQEQPHAHYAMFDGGELFVADLGTDTVFCFDTYNGLKLNEKRSFKTKPGAGPRHLQQNGVFIYSANELTSDVSVFMEENGVFKEIQTISMLDGFKGENTAAAIHLSADRRFLYASNRGHDSVAAYKILNGGTLETIDVISVQGEEPRDFSLSPDDKFLIAANQNSNTVNVFIKNGDTYAYTGHNARVPKPVCVKFLI